LALTVAIYTVAPSGPVTAITTPTADPATLRAAAATAYLQAASTANAKLSQDGGDIAAASNPSQEQAVYAAFVADEHALTQAIQQITFPPDTMQAANDWIGSHQALEKVFQDASQASNPDDYGTQIVVQSKSALATGNSLRSALGLPPIAPGDRA
jgi:hypothetical protein